MTNGLQGGQMIVVAGRPGSGKALARDTPLPTPTGWTTMGEVVVGDLLIGSDGRPTRVVAATEVMLDRPCYEVEFSDGTVITADAEHQWMVTTRAIRKNVEESFSRWGSAQRCIARIERVALAAARKTDSNVSIRELVEELGSDFKSTITRTAHELGAVGREPREFTRRGVGSYMWNAPVYSRQALTTAVLERVAAPIAHEFPPRFEITTTETMAANVRCETSDRRLNYAVPCALPLELPEAELPLPPYLLGAWLGDGTSASATLTCADEQIIDRIRRDGIVVEQVAGNLRYRLSYAPPRIPTRECVVCGATFVSALPQVRTCGKSCGGKATFVTEAVAMPTCPDCGKVVHGWRRCASCHAEHETVQARLRTLGVLGNKHIPVKYLRASERQRRALLAGLLDTDGHATAQGSVEFGVTNKQLAEDVRELVCSLGYRASLRTKSVRGRTPESSTMYTVAFTAAERVFGLDRKAARQTGTVRAGTRSRYVVDVRRVESVPVRCVQVDAIDHLYLAGKTMVPTHNSTLALDVARSAAVKNTKATVLFSLEMGRTEIMMRLFSAEASVPLAKMRSGHLDDLGWRKLASRSGELAEAPLFIDDSPNLNMMEIRAKARRLKQRQDLQMIVIDYLQLMTSGKRVESRQQEVSEFSRAMKLLAKELDVPVVVLAAEPWPRAAHREEADAL